MLGRYNTRAVKYCGSKARRINDRLFMDSVVYMCYMLRSCSKTSSCRSIDIRLRFYGLLHAAPNPGVYFVNAAGLQSLLICYMPAAEP